MLHNIIKVLKEKWAKVESDEIKYYQSARHFDTISSYKVRSRWKLKSPWKFDYWKN